MPFARAVRIGQGLLHKIIQKVVFVRSDRAVRPDRGEHPARRVERILPDRRFERMPFACAIWIRQDRLDFMPQIVPTWVVMRPKGSSSLISCEAAA